MTTKDIRQQFADTMLEVGSDDSRLVVMVADISHFKLQPFAQACPGRFYNVGICEPTIVGMAAGLAHSGLYPVFHTISPFIIERSFEQIKLDFCYHQLGGTLITVGSAFDYANLGCTHHCYGDFALIKTLPGAQCSYPATCLEFDLLFRQTYQNDHLTLLRIPGHQHSVDFTSDQIVFGSGVKIVEGNNLTLIATGPQLRSAMGAREALAALGWDSEVIYIHTVHPLDEDIVRDSVKKTGRVLVIEEHCEVGGLGEGVLRAIADVPSRFAHAAIKGFVREYGSYESHCERLGLTPRGIVHKVAESFGSPDFD